MLRPNPPSSNKETSAFLASVVEDYLLIYLKDSALSWEFFLNGVEHPQSLSIIYVTQPLPIQK